VKFLICFFINLYFTPCLLFSWSPTTEIYVIQNDSNETLFYSVSSLDELDKFSEVLYFEDGILVDKIQIFGPPTKDNRRRVSANGFSMLVEVIKNINIGRLQKFNRLFDTFIVYDSEGYIIMTKEDIDDNSFSIEFGDIVNSYTMTGYYLHITQEMVEVGRQKYAERE
jgi:phage antirepressor YoqD-like protein